MKHRTKTPMTKKKNRKKEEKTEEATNVCFGFLLLIWFTLERTQLHRNPCSKILRHLCLRKMRISLCIGCQEIKGASPTFMSSLPYWDILLKKLVSEVSLGCTTIEKNQARTT
jgi:hypothetical protein